MLQSRGWASSLYLDTLPPPHTFSAMNKSATNRNGPEILEFNVLRCTAGDLSHVYKPHMHAVLFVSENHELPSNNILF